MTQIQINKINRSKLYTIIFVAFIALVAIWSVTANLRRQLASANANLEGYAQGMKQYRNKLNQQVSERANLVVSLTDLKNMHAADSSEIKQLQNIIKKQTQSVTIVTVQTTQTVAATTSVIPNPQNPCKPTYVSHQITPWSEHLVTANSDTTKIKCLVTNEFTFEDYYQRTGPFYNRKKVLTTKMTNKNPNTLTKGLLTYTRPVENKKIWPYILGSFAAGAATTLLLLK